MNPDGKETRMKHSVRVRDSGGEGGEAGQDGAELVDTFSSAFAPPSAVR